MKEECRGQGGWLGLCTKSLKSRPRAALRAPSRSFVDAVQRARRDSRRVGEGGRASRAPDAGNFWRLRSRVRFCRPRPLRHPERSVSRGCCFSLTASISAHRQSWFAVLTRLVVRSTIRRITAPIAAPTIPALLSSMKVSSPGRAAPTFTSPCLILMSS